MKKNFDCNRKKNYSHLFDSTLADAKLSQTKKKLLLHVCCAPCSTAVLEQLHQIFEITCLYCNPNIFPRMEYQQRFDELENYLKNIHSNINLIEIPYDHRFFLEKIKKFEDEKEGGERCFLCYDLRLEKTAEYAKKQGFDFFTTTLSISPHKNAEKINVIGEKLEEKYKIRYLYADFKKKNGCKRSLEISKQFNLYRQDYCGCEFSKSSL